MSTSPEMMEDLARVIMEHPALDAVKERIQMRMFNRWMSATPEQQRIIRDIIDNQGEFFKEISAIYSNSENMEKGDG